MNFNIKQVEDVKELMMLREFMLKQPQYYPKFLEWVDGKCVPRVETGEYKNIIVLSDELLVGDAVYRHLDGNRAEIKNFRIDPEYRRRDLGHFLLKQIEFENPGKTLVSDITVDNFKGVEFFLRNGFGISGKAELYAEDQFEYLLRKALCSVN